MKHFLILLCLLSAVACNNSNVTTKNPKIPFQNNSYLHLPHSKDQSVLRRKLLNVSLTKTLNQKMEVEIDSGDEFKFLNEEHLLGGNEKVDYENYKSTCAEIIVSFNDHLEFFFVPTGIKREDALSQLGVQPESGETLFWAMETPSVLTKGHIYYLVSASTSDIKNNDVNFYQQKLAYKELNSQSFQFKNNQKITLDFKINYYLKQTAVVTRAGAARTTRCTRDMSEAGLCGGCDYKIEVATGGKIQKQWQKQDFRMTLKLNGVEYSLDNLDSMITSEGNLEITLDLRQMNLSEDVTLEILPFSVQKVTRSFSGFDFAPTCRVTNVVEAQDLTPEIHADLSVEVMGRVL